MSTKEVVRLGGGSAHGRDLLEPAIALAESGEIDYLVFDCLSEKAILDNEVSKSRGGIAWDPFQEYRMRKTIPACAKTGTKIITNMGAADPSGAAMRTAEICRELGFPDLKVMAVAGDYLIDEVRRLDPSVSETGKPVSSMGDELLAAYAYISGQGIVQALRMGADIVVSGRVGDSTQFLAPLIYEFDWPSDHWDLLAKGQGIGHLLECAAQVSGGYFADPPYKVVHDLHKVGFPIANVERNGDATITKLPGTGGLVNRLTVIEQLLYEIGDPSDYKHTDVTVDFSTTEIADIGANAVSVTGTTGHPKPPTVKVCSGRQRRLYGHRQSDVWWRRFLRTRAANSQDSCRPVRDARDRHIEATLRLRGRERALSLAGRQLNSGGGASPGGRLVSYASGS